MAPAAAKVLSEALALSSSERAELARALLRSLDESPDEDPAEVAAAWAAELERRAAGVADGSIATMPLEQALEEIRSDLKTRREARDR